MGVTFSADSRALVICRAARTGTSGSAIRRSGPMIGSVNLNGAAHPLDRPLGVIANPARRFKGAFPGNMVLSDEGRYLYVVDQGSFKVHVIDISKIETGVDAQARVVGAGQLRGGGRRSVEPSAAIRSGSRCRRTTARCSSRTSASSSTRTCGRPPRPAIRTSTTRSATRASATRTRRATIGPFKSRRSIHATCPTTCAIPTASAAATSRPTRRTRFPGWAARTSPSPRRSTCWTSTIRNAPSTA